MPQTRRSPGTPSNPSRPGSRGPRTRPGPGGPRTSIDRPARSGRQFGAAGRRLRGRREVVRHDVGRAIEPEQRQRRQDAALVGDRRRQHRVERREPVARHHQQVVAEAVQLAHLARTCMERLQRVRHGRSPASAASGRRSRRRGGGSSSRSNAASRAAGSRRLVDLGVGRQQPAERAVRRPRPAARCAGRSRRPARGAGPLATRASSTRPENTSPWDALQVAQHPLRVDLQPLHQPQGAVEHVVEEDGRVGQHDALRRGVGDVALVPERRCSRTRPGRSRAAPAPGR